MNIINRKLKTIQFTTEMQKNPFLKKNHLSHRTIYQEIFKHLFNKANNSFKLEKYFQLIIV